jgi:tRNA 2-selenouridine synthase
VDYYDPMYDYQIGQKAERIIFRGDPKSVTEYVSQQSTRVG